MRRNRGSCKGRKPGSPSANCLELTLLHSHCHQGRMSNGCGSSLRGNDDLIASSLCNPSLRAISIPATGDLETNHAQQDDPKQKSQEASSACLTSRLPTDAK